MIASRIGRAGTRFGPTRFGGSSSAMIGSTIAHSSSGTRQIGGSGFRSFFARAILHLLLSRTCSPHASLEIVTWTTTGGACSLDVQASAWHDLERRALAANVRTLDDLGR